MRQAGWRLLVKRAIDVACAAAALVVATPVMTVVAVAIKVAMPGPILFRQRRPGRYGEPFTIYKFRTMVVADGARRSDAERLTSFGRFLRSSSLDELPQLFNVLRGDVSLVGPRPLLMQYLPLYDEEQARRHDVLPGITGWAQIHGRNAISWDQKFAHDVWYVDHWSLGLDARIVAHTLGYVLRRRDITRGDGHATTPEFTGSVQAMGGMNGTR